MRKKSPLKRFLCFSCLWGIQGKAVHLLGYAEQPQNPREYATVMFCLWLWASQQIITEAVGICCGLCKQLQRGEYLYWIFLPSVKDSKDKLVPLLSSTCDSRKPFESGTYIQLYIWLGMYTILDIKIYMRVNYRPHNILSPTGAKSNV